MPEYPSAELSSREYRLLERLLAHPHYSTRSTVGARPAVRQAGLKGKPIFTVRLRNLERAGLITFDRVNGRLVVVPTAAGERTIAERRQARRFRLDGGGSAVRWWL